jgi:hypothetical protein
MLANYLNECRTAGEKPSWSWDEKSLSSCDKRILQITQKPIADAENTARNTVPKTRFWETVHVIDSQSHAPFGAVSARYFYHTLLYEDKLNQV